MSGEGFWGKATKMAQALKHEFQGGDEDIIHLTLRFRRKAHHLTTHIFSLLQDPASLPYSDRKRLREFLKEFQEPEFAKLRQLMRFEEDSTLNGFRQDTFGTAMARNNHVNVIEIMVEQGIDLTKRNIHGETPMSIAHREKYTSFIETFAELVKTGQDHTAVESYEKHIAAKIKEAIAKLEHH